MNRPPSPAAPTALLLLGFLLASGGAAGQGTSGLHPLFSGVDALAVRLELVDQARQSVDAQYYIWKPDATGRLLVHRLLHAADRGVRVRLLLDDIGCAPDDEELLALDNHRNIEVRLFNPVADRRLRGLSALLDFKRINRRMHNKTFTVDGRFSIVGGRNISDEYFAANPAMEFADLDMLATGPVVAEASHSFETYWTCAASRPITKVTGLRPSSRRRAGLLRTLSERVEAEGASAYARSLSSSEAAHRLRQGTLPFQPGRAWLVYDDPAKIEAPPADTSTHLVPRLRPVMEAARREALVVTPYFIPGDSGVSFFSSLRRRGVRVAVLTNSLAALDMPAVYSGYQRYRKPLLRAGVEVYEVPRQNGERRRRTRRWLGRSAAASLHAKTFVFDRRTVFVGSLNLDPRSVELNTEIGVVFESRELAAHIVGMIEQTFLRGAYRLDLRTGPGPDRLVWLDPDEENRVVSTHEPDTSWQTRCRTSLLSLLPIEGQL